MCGHGQDGKKARRRSEHKEARRAFQSSMARVQTASVGMWMQVRAGLAQAWLSDWGKRKELARVATGHPPLPTPETCQVYRVIESYRVSLEALGYDGVEISDLLLSMWEAVVSDGGIGTSTLDTVTAARERFGSDFEPVGEAILKLVEATITEGEKRRWSYAKFPEFLNLVKRGESPMAMGKLLMGQFGKAG